ncbi:hypothetical protein [Azospirillum sp. B4]|uniref:hypothetical protein n=1 Tax=Azospirillum sp. B4 TaxID=95605 RepID=UPI0005C80F08|nr:hypothetical protein [Azospirillum sp. B4]
MSGKITRLLSVAASALLLVGGSVARSAAAEAGPQKVTAIMVSCPGIGAAKKMALPGMPLVMDTMHEEPYVFGPAYGGARGTLNVGFRFTLNAQPAAGRQGYYHVTGPLTCLTTGPAVWQDGAGGTKVKRLTTSGVDMVQLDVVIPVRVPTVVPAGQKSITLLVNPDWLVPAGAVLR